MLGAAFGIAPAREGLGKTQSDAKDLLRNTIVATVNKVYLDRYLEEYQKQFLINKMVRLDEDTLAEKLNNDADMVENWHCQIVKKFNARNLLRECG